MSVSPFSFEPIALYVLYNPFQPKLERLRPDEFLHNPYDSEPHTRLEVLISSPADYITGLWTEAFESELKSFHDDTGFDLLTNGGGATGSGPSPEFSAATIDLSGNSAPAAAATRLIARGDLLISTASGITPIKSKPFELLEGVEIDVAGFVFRISEVDYRDDINGPAKVTFKRTTVESKMKDVARIYFEATDGNNLDFELRYSQALGSDEDYELEDMFVFRTGSGKAVLVVECWEDRFEWIEEYEIISTLTCRPG